MLKNYRVLPLGFSLAVLLVSACGCGSGAPPLPPTYKVSGTVTYKGEPIKKGSILMQGQDDIAEGRPPATADIVDGSYSLKIYEGEKTVQISSKVENGSPDATGVTPMKELIPEKYNTKSDLKTTVSEGENTANFDLK